MDLNDTTFTKRLIKEMKDLKHYKDIKKLHLIYPFDDEPLMTTITNHGISKDTPYYQIKIDNNILTIFFNESYPFKAPILFINNIYYYNCYKNSRQDKYSNDINLELQRKFDIPCLCCYSKLCKWCPGIQIKDILDEYKNIRKIKRYLNAYQVLLELNNYHNNILPVEIIEKIRDMIWLC